MSATVSLIGVRIESTDFFQNKNYTVVSSPAPDAFSHPSKYRLTSDKPLGNNGTVMDIDCTMRGMVRLKNYIDKQTGQQKTYNECDVYFDVYAARQHVSPAPLHVAHSPEMPLGIKKN